MLLDGWGPYKSGRLHSAHNQVLEYTAYQKKLQKSREDMEFPRYSGENGVAETCHKWLRLPGKFVHTGGVRRAPVGCWVPPRAMHESGLSESFRKNLL